MIRLFWKIGLLLGSVSLLLSCSGEEGAVGEELLGAGKVAVRAMEDSNLVTENLKDTTSDLSGVSTALLGTLNDDVFGKTQSGFAFQLRLLGALKLREPVVDSVKLFLEYTNYYGGDTALMQTAKAYLLKDAIQYAKLYNASTKIEQILGEQVGVANFNKKLASDTIFLKSKLDATKDSVIDSKKQVDTILRHLVIPLDKEKVGGYILSGSETDFESSANFINYFKGLYVSTEDISGSQGTIYGFNIYNSYMRVYFKNLREVPNATDTLYATTLTLPITDNSARFNSPKFSQPENLISSSDYLYLQGIHGTKASIKMPDLNSWKDSTRVSINKAELVFKVASDSVEISKYPLPYRLELVAVDNEGKKHFLRYSSYAGNIPNGLLNFKEKTYSFHIPEFLQDIADKKVTFNHFELAAGTVEQRQSLSGVTSYPGDAKNTPSRVILYNSGKYKPTLKVTYTKY